VELKAAAPIPNDDDDTARMKVSRAGPKSARRRAGIEGYVRPSHHLRHSSITNAAAAGIAPEALMSRSGHSSHATTLRHIDLAGVRFREEAKRIEDRLWGDSGTKNRYHEPVAASSNESEEAPEARI